MNVVDIAIVLLLVLSALQGFRSGLIQSVFSLAGLIAGIAIASWNYARFADPLSQTMHSRAVADAISFCLIALVVMLVAGLLGMLLRGVVHGVGLGWLDKFLGFFFGLVRGAVLATLCIVTLAAFFPDTQWLGQATLSRYFLGSAHLTTHITPQELKVKVMHGLRMLEDDAPRWLDRGLVK
jgi:membrane protein required for colicin V production